jgi:hypothetical protein
MHNVKLVLILTVLGLTAGSPARAQVAVSDSYLRLNAGGNDPLFTTYAAAMERSRFFADKAYFMDYFNPDKPMMYSSQFAGDLAVVWKVNNVVVNAKGDFASAPVVEASFPDMAVLSYEVMKGLSVQETFSVYSSGAAVVHLHLTNEGPAEFRVSVYPLLHLPEDSLAVDRFDVSKGGLFFTHVEPLERLHSNLYANRGYPTIFRDCLASAQKPTSFGSYRACTLEDFRFDIKRMSKQHVPVTELNGVASGRADLVALQQDVVLKPGGSADLRFVRGVQDARQSEQDLVSDVQAALDADLQSCVDANIRLFAKVPRINFKMRGEKMVYLGAFNLVRQCMLPPSGKTTRNYYVFSRNPQWGWGHGHQVMHESLSMIPYAYLDLTSAEESQRIFMDQQYPDGLIAYRVGPRGPQVYPHQGEPTTSAPFFSWTNWEIYRIGRNREFLRDAYVSGARYIRFMEQSRDKDRDGMFEWGPYGIIENVRDGWNAVFQLFSGGEDEGRDISGELDALDLTIQMANEMYCLREMASELGDADGRKEWGEKFARTAALVNRHMWDFKDKFYYHIAMSDHSFQFEGESLKRKEIIGFLPLWAHVATRDRAKDLLAELRNPASFNRPFGVPTLAANDPQYTPFVDGCCRWNGPIWQLWDYMLVDGLRSYGYAREADALGARMVKGVIVQLAKNHRFWESYSPDYTVLECPSNYIWDSILAKVLIDIYGKH